LERLPVASGITFFPDLSARSPAIFFKFAEGWKARSHPEKSFVAGGNFKPSFWNLEAVLRGSPGTVFITEGEMDAAALVEAGVSEAQVLSVPTGAKMRAADNPQAERGYSYVLDALKAGLAKTKRFVWCGDADEPGLALRSDMVRLLGAARFAFLAWPAGTNDANEMLIKAGPDALHELLTQGGSLWPQEGLYRLSELPEPPPLTLWTPNIPTFQDKVHLAPRTLSLVTGQPGHGKTLAWGQIWQEICQTYGLVCCVASFETRPRPHMRRQLRTLLSGLLENQMSETDKEVADRWIEDHYLFLVHNEQRPTLDWFLECAETAVIRHGAKIIQLDPWNRLEATRARDETESEYILRCLRALHVFANDMDCHVQIVAHPSKMDGARRGQAPALEDVSGSKHWENIVDQGFVVHRPQMFQGTDRKTHTAFYHRKARFEELGYPCKLMLNFELLSRRYVPLVAGEEDEAQ
jgi:twinkle protein